ncbi:inositol monophosphatase [Bisporella sp. PMI_857]|nr:inositol monophosphatase [Bisporella sp. PMI_857]
MSTEIDLQEIHHFAIELARGAGRILIDGVDARISGTAGGADGGKPEEKEKMNAVDIVTQTDLDVEAYVKSEINKKYPSHKFIGEETYSAGSAKEYLVNDDPTWVVDPLDGTVNYTHLFPMFCVSIAFCLGGDAVVGVIYQPMLDVLYHGFRGGGSWMGGPVGGKRKLPFVAGPKAPLPKNAPKGCIFSCEWGKDRRDIEGGNMRRKIASFTNMAAEIGGRGGKGGMVHGVRSLGSATLDLAYVATGALDIWWEGGCWEWDVAAGICILREAGGLITTANPPPDPATDPIPDVRLGSRLYLAIRPAGDSQGETGRQAQERVVREVWRRVEGLDYDRPGA